MPLILSILLPPLLSYSRSFGACELPGTARQFSIVTEGDAQISGQQIYGALHVGGTVISNPSKPFYSQQVDEGDRGS
eukprot:scaffold75481_cov27-Tisochrysis_lutea.AAC.1